METTREIALRAYKDATGHGMMDTPMNWHIWKRAFDTAERELKNLKLGAVVGRTEQLKAFADYAQKRVWEDGDKDLSEFVDEFLRL